MRWEFEGTDYATHANAHARTCALQAQKHVYTLLLTILCLACSPLQIFSFPVLPPPCGCAARERTSWQRGCRGWQRPEAAGRCQQEFPGQGRQERGGWEEVPWEGHRGGVEHRVSCWFAFSPTDQRSKQKHLITIVPHRHLKPWSHAIVTDSFLMHLCACVFVCRCICACPKHEGECAREMSLNDELVNLIA